MWWEPGQTWGRSPEDCSAQARGELGGPGVHESQRLEREATSTWGHHPPTPSSATFPQQKTPCGQRRQRQLRQLPRQSHTVSRGPEASCSQVTTSRSAWWEFISRQASEIPVYNSVPTHAQPLQCHPLDQARQQGTEGSSYPTSGHGGFFRTLHVF